MTEQGNEAKKQVFKYEVKRDNLYFRNLEEFRPGEYRGEMLRKKVGTEDDWGIVPISGYRFKKEEFKKGEIKY